MKKSKHAVETKNLSISWGKVNVLNQINFELNDGEKLAIVGPSGSGKSTILKILAGLLLPTKGELRIFGEKQTYLRLDQNNPPDVRLVFQNPALLGSLTIEENVGFLLKRNKKLSKNSIHYIVRECLAEVGLFNVENKLPIAIVYATWSGLGIFTIEILGYIFFKQSLSWQAILGLFLIVMGVILLNTNSSKLI